MKRQREWYTQHTLHCGIYMHCHASCNWCANQVTLDCLSLGPIANQKNVVVMKYLISTNLIIWWVQIASGKKVPESWKNVILALLQILANYQLQLKEKSNFLFWGVPDVNDHFELHLPCIPKLSYWPAHCSLLVACSFFIWRWVCFFNWKPQYRLDLRFSN